MIKYIKQKKKMYNLYLNDVIERRYPVGYYLFLLKSILTIFQDFNYIIDYLLFIKYVSNKNYKFYTNQKNKF